MRWLNVSRLFAVWDYPVLASYRLEGAGVGAQAVVQSPFDRLSADPERVAETGFKGMMAGRVVVLDGAANRFGAFMTRFLPRCLVRRIAGGMLAKLK